MDQILPDTFSVTDFREHTAEHLRRLKKSKRPTLLTQNGRAAAVVLSPGAYEQLASDAETARSIERLRQSIREADRGEVHPVAEAMERVRAKLRKRAGR